MRLRKVVALVGCGVCCWVCSTRSAYAQLIVAHRGASYDAPENTVAAFSLAWEHQADAFEGDFYLARDQKIVCIHDDTTERVAKVNLSVSETSLAELQKLDVGKWKGPQFVGLHMPDLKEVLDCIPHQKRAYFEVKCGPDIVPLMQRELDAADLQPDQTVIISFNEAVVQAAKKLMADRQAYWLVDFKQDETTGLWRPTCEDVIHTALRIGADGVNVAGKVEVVNRHFVDRCHQEGLSVHVWTIDNPEQARLFQQLGVASITTNRPRELRRALFPSPAASVSRAPAAVGVPQSTSPAAVP